MESKWLAWNLVERGNELLNYWISIDFIIPFHQVPQLLHRLRWRFMVDNWWWHRWMDDFSGWIIWFYYVLLVSFCWPVPWAWKQRNMAASFMGLWAMLLAPSSSVRSGLPPDSSTSNWQHVVKKGCFYQHIRPVNVTNKVSIRSPPGFRSNIPWFSEMANFNETSGVRSQ